MGIALVGMVGGTTVAVISSTFFGRHGGRRFRLWLGHKEARVVARANTTVLRARWLFPGCHVGGGLSLLPDSLRIGFGGRRRGGAGAD